MMNAQMIKGRTNREFALKIKNTYRATAQKKRSGDANMRFPITRFERSLDPEYVL
jgi:hypothetical protein